MSWQQVKIGSFLKRIKRPVKVDANSEYKLVTIRINHNGVSLRDMKRGSELKSNMYEVKEGDFILSGIDARNGAFGIIPKELDGALVTNDFWYFDIDESVIDKHFFLELTSTNWFDEICKRGSDGTTQRIRLQKDKFFNQIITLPKTMAFQKELLSKITNVKTKQIELSNEISLQKDYLAKLKQSILQDAICGKLTEDWRAENPDVEPASELLKRIKAEKEQMIKEGKIRKEKPLEPITESELPFEIPDTWQWCRLGDLCSKTGSGSTPKGGKSAYPSRGIYFLRSQNIYNDGITLDGVAFISDKTHKSMSATQVKQEDLLLNITGGSIGRCAMVPKEFEEANINQHVAIIRLIDKEMGNLIHSVIISNYFQQMIVKAQTGAGREGLPKNKMDQILIPIPPQKEQKIIDEIIKKSLEKCSLIEAQITANELTAQNLLKSILSENFNNN
jgi:restriction endonuclease S subunit